MARARGSNALLAGSFESTYGTAATTGYHQLPFVSAGMGEEQNLIPSDLLGYGREPLPPSLDVINNDGDVVVPVDVRNFGYWLKLLLGQPTDTGTAPTITHVFTSGALALPAMTLEVGMPEVPSFGQNIGVRANTMRINMQRSGLLNATMGLIAKGENKLTTTGAGTPTTSVVRRFSQFQGSVLKGGVALAHVTTADFIFSNNLDKVEVIAADGRIEDADPGMVSCTGSITTRFADTTLLAQAQAGTPVDVEFGWTIDSSNSLLFRVNQVYLPRVKTPVTGPNGILATFNFQSSRDNTTGATLVATLINDVTTY